MSRLNPWQYANQIIRVVDVYGRRCWLDKAGYDNDAKPYIHICRYDGMRRINTPAGEDNHNIMHQDNIARVLQNRDTGEATQAIDTQKCVDTTCPYRRTMWGQDNKPH